MFTDCMENEKNIEPIIDNMKYGKKLGVNSVPTIFVNGFPVVGNVDKDKIKAVLSGENILIDD